MLRSFSVTMCCACTSLNSMANRMTSVGEPAFGPYPLGVKGTKLQDCQPLLQFIPRLCHVGTLRGVLENIAQSLQFYIALLKGSYMTQLSLWSQSTVPLQVRRSSGP